MGKIKILALCMIFTILFCGLSFAKDTDKLPSGKNILPELLSLKYKVMGLSDLKQDGIITSLQAETGINKYLSQARVLTGNPDYSFNDLLNTQSAAGGPELTYLQKAAGFVSLINILWVMAICVGVFCLIYLAIHWINQIIAFFRILPLAFYEVLFYAVSIGLTAWGIILPEAYGAYVTLTGCVLFAGSIIFTTKVHDKKFDTSAFFLVLAAFYSPLAIILKSQMIGFISVIAVMGFLGFSAMVIPCGYAIGFRDDDALERSTVAGFMMVLFFVTARMGMPYIPQLAYFERGALFLGTFVGYLGLLIASSRWYSGRSSYALFQFVTIVAGISALVVGSIWNIGELTKIGGTFFVLYLIEKPFEIPLKKGSHYAMVGLFVSAVVYFGCAYASSHPQLVNAYLLYSF
jgi:hypothetical protein